MFFTCFTHPIHDGQLLGFVFTPYALQPGNLNLQSLQIAQIATTIGLPDLFIAHLNIFNVETWLHPFAILLDVCFSMFLGSFFRGAPITADPISIDRSNLLHILFSVARVGWALSVSSRRAVSLGSGGSNFFSKFRPRNKVIGSRTFAFWY